MAVQTRGGTITAMNLSDTKDSIFPLISHVAPIWPLEKRIEKMKARKPTFWRLVRNKITVLRFLQSINPTMKGLFLQVTDEEELGSNIVALTRNFQEEQRKKYERMYEIQMEAYLRAEKKKSVWDKGRDRECATEWRTTRESLANGKRTSTILTSKSLRLGEQTRATKKIRCQTDIQTRSHKEDNTKSQQRRYKAQSFRSLKEEFVFPERNDEIYLPQIYGNGKGAKRPINDPRFERLLNSLIPPPNNRGRELRNTNASRNKDAKEKESVSSDRLSGKNLHEKWQESTATKHNDKNVSKSVHVNKTKFTRPVGGRWPDQIKNTVKLAKSN